MQKVKINAGFCDKISENYNSQQYSVSLEMECSINGKTVEVEAAADKLFSLCKKIIDRQKNLTKENLFPLDKPAQTSFPPRAIRPRGVLFISYRQKKAIYAICKSIGKNIQEIQSLIQLKLNKHLEQMTRVEASNLIQELSTPALWV